ncbi:MAG: helix-turn-helix domain-containing protein [Nitriliruptorales bacterium]|nr:helix-turn-helix domain-containing protein [Nitriliruptorales bacterium]
MSIGIGEQLREARQTQGHSVDDAASATRMRADYIRALEDEEFGVFGGDVYAKGFLSTYARFLGLDPQPLLEEYRRYVQAEGYDAAAIATSAESHGPKAPPPRWIAWGVVVVAVLAGAIVLTNLSGGRSPSPADEPTEIAGSPGPTAGETAAPSPSPSPSPTPTFEGVNLELTFEGRSWAHLEEDGETTLERVVEDGETLTLQGDESVFVWVGNAGVVAVTFNGEDRGTLGGEGEVVRVTFTPEGPEEA